MSNSIGMNRLIPTFVAGAIALALSGCSTELVPLTYYGPLWCYSTLAEPMCYAEEQPQYRTRLIGAYVER